MTRPGVRIGHLLSCVAFLVLVVGESPHLVHHAFDPDQAGNDCLFAASSDHVCALAPVVVSLVVELLPGADTLAAPPASLPGRALPARVARAPPARPLA
jgi:hypothetical protein